LSMLRDSVCVCLYVSFVFFFYFFFFQAEDGIRDSSVTGVQTCALPIFLESLLNPQSTLTGKCSTASASFRTGVPGLRCNLILPRSEERRVGKEWKCWWRG